MKENQFVLSVIVSNQFGVLARVSGLFSRRGYNIDSLNVSETENPRYSRMTILVTGDEYIKSQIVKQVEKLQEVKVVELMSEKDTLLREHILIKIKVTTETRAELTEAINIFKGKIIDFNTKSITVEMTGECSKLDGFIEYVKQFGIIEMCRAGALAIKRGSEYLCKV